MICNEHSPRSLEFKYFLHGSVCCTIIFLSAKARDGLAFVSNCCFVIASLIVDLMLFDEVDGFVSVLDAPVG